MRMWRLLRSDLGRCHAAAPRISTSSQGEQIVTAFLTTNDLLHDDVQMRGALPDATLPDATLPDATLPDATLPDATLPDATLQDAALCRDTLQFPRRESAATEKTSQRYQAKCCYSVAPLSGPARSCVNVENWGTLCHLLGPMCLPEVMHLASTVGPSNDLFAGDVSSQ